MLKRLLLIATATGAIILGGALAANATEQHHAPSTGQHQQANHHKKAQHHQKGKHHHQKPTPKPVVKPHPNPVTVNCTCHKRKPKPPGGWPCKATNTCHPHHHPVCPPKKHHHHPKPPVTPPWHATPKPPVVTHHTTHKVVHHATPELPATPTTGTLAFTGASPGMPIYLRVAGGAIGFGALLCFGASMLPKRDEELV